MKKLLNILFLIFIFLFIITNSNIIFSQDDEEELSLEEIYILSGEELEEKKDTTKIAAPEIDYSMLDETYIIPHQTKDIAEEKEKRVILWLSQISSSNNDFNLKRDAILALGKLKEKRAIPDLIKILSDTTADEDIRMYASWALGNIGQDCIPELEKITKNKDLKTRIYAIWALGVSKSKSVIPILKRIDEETSPEDKITKKVILNVKKIFDTTLFIPENW